MAMSEENVETTPVSQVAGAYEGAVGIRRFFADIEDAGPDFRLHIERLEAAGAERVLAFTRLTFTGAPVA